VARGRSSNWPRAFSLLEVVDLGCGTGVLTVEMARWAKRVVAIDANSEALAKARECAQRAGSSNVTFCARISTASLSRTRKRIWSSSPRLHHVEDPPTLLAEAARILKSGGRLVLLELMPHDERWVRCARAGSPGRGPTSAGGSGARTCR
jgi:ArsR family transcriptional regulator